MVSLPILVSLTVEFWVSGMYGFMKEGDAGGPRLAKLLPVNIHLFSRLKGFFLGAVVMKEILSYPTRITYSGAFSYQRY